MPKITNNAHQYNALFTEIVASNFSTGEQICIDWFKSAEQIAAAVMERSREE